MNTKTIEHWARHGLWVDTYSPGDGVTRYRFFDRSDMSYFGDKGIYTAMGWKEACIFAEGWVAAVVSNWGPLGPGRIVRTGEGI